MHETLLGAHDLVDSLDTYKSLGPTTQSCIECDTDDANLKMIMRKLAATHEKLEQVKDAPFVKEHDCLERVRAKRNDAKLCIEAVKDIRISDGDLSLATLVEEVRPWAGGASDALLWKKRGPRLNRLRCRPRGCDANADAQEV